MAAQEALHALIEIKTQEDLAAPAEHHHKCHQRSLCTADLNVMEVTPVDLCLFTRQGSESKIRFTRFARSQLRHMRAEMAGPTRVATLLRHCIQPRGRERGVLLQCLDDEGYVGINDRGCSCTLGLGHARLRQHTVDNRVMNAELGGNGMRAPELYKVIAKNLRLECLADSQWSSPPMWS